MSLPIFPEPFDLLDRLVQARTAAKLLWHYGPEKAARIVAGDDPLTNLDIAKWNALGARGDRRAATT